jgi:hypothetical protein
LSVKGPTRVTNTRTWSDNCQRRLLDRRRRIDYLLLAGLALAPIVLAPWVGLNESACLQPPDLDSAHEGCQMPFRGFWQSYNFTALVIMLPVGLYLLRWLASHLFGDEDPALALDRPVILTALKEEARPVVRQALAERAFAGRVLVLALALDLMFHVADLWDTAHAYLAHFFPGSVTVAAGSKVTWSEGFLAAERYRGAVPVDALANLGFSAVAYASQFVIVLLAIMAMVLCARFNTFYLALVYQRSRAPGTDVGPRIVLDLDDADRAFGLKRLHFAFDIQLLGLVAAGIFVLVSRYANVAPAARPNVLATFPERFSITQLQAFLASLEPGLFFPDVGQVIMSASWILAFGIVLLPAMTKLLPLRWQGFSAAQTGVIAYLREYIPPRDEKQRHRLESDAEVSTVAAKFARNAFWPAGDEIAAFFLYFAFFVFFTILFPIHLGGLTGVLGTAVLFAASIAVSRGILRLFRFVLGRVDRRLVA